jgi:hypothetical protein
MDFTATGFVCGWRGSIPPGRCSRAVIENLELLLSKLLSKHAYASFLLPAGVLLRLTPLWRRAKEAVIRRCKPSYRAVRFEVDSEFAAVLMYGAIAAYKREHRQSLCALVQVHGLRGRLRAGHSSDAPSAV